ncbi:hypothetical protein [Rhodanobacter thiooxydans]|uniref:hypothetical protein n=1 Tax=Rhodanobacter thiooxydans TaxID=416169 RepID=UPI00131F0E41|nr:hypothetical protein [Rhodanobacter thiooxydans]
MDPAWSLALKARGSVFSHQLAKALEEDSAAQTRAEGEIVGLDFDPFLNSQDPGQHYKVGRITQKGDSYWVDIHDASSSGWLHEKPGVIAEVVRKNGQWHFVNFHYSNGRDLLDALKELKASRGKPSSQAIRGAADESRLAT